MLILEFCFAFTIYGETNQNKAESNVEYKWHPRRGEKFEIYLKPAIRVGRASGTICYYSTKTKYAYVLTCAHVIHEPTEKQDVEIFWNNNKAIRKTYKATILCMNEEEDLSLLRFKPGFPLPYAPIAHYSSKYYIPTLAPKQTKLISTGRDVGTDPAAYIVEVTKPYKGGNWWLTTKKNKARGGRSGGGLFNAGGYIVGVTYGYSKEADEGYYAPLWRIYRFVKANNMSWLLNIQKPAQAIPVMNRNSSSRKSFIPMPVNKF